ncbi:hypothetical protein [Demequina aurantiaca]|uniref:hypothetical protein n=1 Tax=Demequina aurantiaca TaxID=676200 RepID=UPI000A97E632|nr:hypothetical protein [Demequina aurantiaca]
MARAIELAAPNASAAGDLSVATSETASAVSPELAGTGVDGARQAGVASVLLAAGLGLLALRSRAFTR